LKPGGYFIIGGSESLSSLNHSLKYIEPSVYKCADLDAMPNMTPYRAG